MGGLSSAVKPFIEKCIGVYDRIVGTFSWPQDVILLLIRIGWGFAFSQAGMGKLGNLEGVTGFFESLGIPAPGFHAALVAYTEMIGGLMLLLGLFGRLAAVPLSFAMIVAYATAHSEELGKLFTEDWTEFLEASPGPYLLASLIILFFGSGRLSLDALWKRFCPCRQAATADNRGS